MTDVGDTASINGAEEFILEGYSYLLEVEAAVVEGGVTVTQGSYLLEVEAAVVERLVVVLLVDLLPDGVHLGLDLAPVHRKGGGQVR